MRSSMMWVAGVLALGACGPSGGDSGGDSSDPDTGEPAPMTFAFSFAVFADPHVYAESPDSEYAQRLAAAVAWVNDQAAERSIELVLVVGDIGWGEGLETAKDLLDGLEVPYAPVIGDNEVQSGDEEAFDELYAEARATLEASASDWSEAERPVYNPEYDTQSWFQNYAFDLEGIRFVMVDWCSRDIGSILGELAELHDFEGGTWPWVQEELADVEGRMGESVILASHNPMGMFPGGFDEDQLATVGGFVAERAAWIHADYAGHHHVDYSEVMEDYGYEVHITDAIHDDDNTVRVVSVSTDGASFSYEQELVVVD